VRIFATDIDAEAIAFARRGVYPLCSVEDLPEVIVNKYFTRAEDGFQVRKSLRSMTVFGEHDLGQRAPFPNIDIITCRNVMIYFTQELQRRALQSSELCLLASPRRIPDPRQGRDDSSQAGIFHGLQSGT
jgi:two-component system, chemotaxis family, CheB/CheR fusion protein